MNIGSLGRQIRDGWLILGIALLVLCLIEASFSLAFFIKDQVMESDPSADSAWVRADANAHAPWAVAYDAEFARSAVPRWMPYVYWRRLPYRGDHINVDADGIRRTLGMASRNQPSTRPLKIFMFGGSTMWGTGARDAFTIPSVLARELNRKGIAVDVINFGESGYVSTQETVALLMQLRKGQRPDLVIFYDGVNDVFSAYQQAVAGLPQNEFNRVEEFNLSQPGRLQERAAMTLRDAARGLATTRFAKWLLHVTGIWHRPAKNASPVGLAGHGDTNASLAGDVVAAYKANLDVVRALGDHYGFRYLFYWQPTIFQKPLLSSYETSVRESMKPIEPFFRQVYQALQVSGLSENSDNAFRDISAVFGGTTEPIYLDWCHLSEQGNEIIARRMVADVLGALNTGR